MASWVHWVASATMRPSLTDSLSVIICMFVCQECVHGQVHVYSHMLVMLSALLSEGLLPGTPSQVNFRASNQAHI